MEAEWWLWAWYKNPVTCLLTFVVQVQADLQFKVLAFRQLLAVWFSGTAEETAFHQRSDLCGCLCSEEKLRHVNTNWKQHRVCLRPPLTRGFDGEQWKYGCDWSAVGAWSCTPHSFTNLFTSWIKQEIVFCPSGQKKTWCKNRKCDILRSTFQLSGLSLVITQPGDIFLMLVGCSFSTDGLTHNQCRWPPHLSVVTVSNRRDKTMSVFDHLGWERVALSQETSWNELQWEGHCVVLYTSKSICYSFERLIYFSQTINTTANRIIKSAGECAGLI